MRSPRLILLAAVALPLAACGSSGSSGSTSASALTSKQASFLAFSQCMRAHGVPNFPDITDGMRVQQTPNSTSVNGVSVNSPAFKSAMQMCQTKLPNGGKGQPLSNSQRQKALQFSACMRSHGLPNFPDPTFSPNGGAQLRLSASSGIDPNSPAFKSAQAACGSIIGKAG